MRHHHRQNAHFFWDIIVEGMLEIVTKIGFSIEIINLILCIILCFVNAAIYGTYDPSLLKSNERQKYSIKKRFARHW